MPINYKLYPANWKTEIRPRILQKAGNRCEICKVKNHEEILRGTWKDKECYQDMDGTIWDANNGDRLGDDYVGEVHPTNKLIKVVLTIAHMNHDINDNSDGNLKALCQRCHNRHDIEHRKANRKKNRGELSLFG